MPKAVFVVQSQASDELREEEYHKWYENTHIPQLCEIPGINERAPVHAPERGVRSG